MPSRKRKDRYHPIDQLMQAGVPLEHITMTSYGCGSLPDFDKDGNIIKLVSGDPASILRETIDAVYEKKYLLNRRC